MSEAVLPWSTMAPFLQQSNELYLEPSHGAADITTVLRTEGAL